MSEKDLSNAFLRGEGPIDLDALTSYVLRRDRMRIWLLGIGCVIAWMLVVMLPWSTVLPMLAKIGQYHAQSSAATPTTLQDRAQSVELLMIVKKGTLATFFGSIASMFLAAVCTVSLIVLSRRATLRQVNMRLQEISTQIKGLTGQK